MAQESNVVRLQARVESFPSIADHSDEQGRLSPVTDEDENPLWEENDQLRRQVKSLKAQLLVLQRQVEGTKRSTGSKKPPRSPRKGKHSTSRPAGVVVELPADMQADPERKEGWTRNRATGSLKDHRSVSTEDDQETVEASPDVEIHESAAGLHHRTPSNQTPTYGKISPSTATALPVFQSYKQTIVDPPEERPDPLCTLDGSFSSVDTGDDEEAMLKLVDGNEGCGEELKSLLHQSSTATTQLSSRAEESSHAVSFEEETFVQAVSDRAGWLVGLLVLQSMSGFLLERNEVLLKHHHVIVNFLTMLVGAGGNAGNQASVRGLAVGTIDNSNVRRFLRREMAMGLALSVVLALAGCVRAAVFATKWMETVAITTSLFMIVIISIVLGALMPLGMNVVGIDPAHSSITIQVVMDILGVSITLWISSLILDAGFPDWFPHMGA